MRRKIAILILGVLLWYGGLAQAVPITIEISGNITSIGGDVGSIPDTIYDGANFTGTYTYDSLASDSDSDPHRGVYAHDAPYGISMVIGGYEFKTAPNHTGNFEMQIGDDLSSNGVKDFYTVFSDNNVYVPPDKSSIDWVGWYRWDLWDTTHSVLSSDALPLTNPDLTDWDHNVLEIYGYGFGNLSIIEGTVTQVVLIPEPSSVILMIMGIFLYRRRR